MSRVDADNEFSRKTFLKAGGALVVSFGLPVSLMATGKARAGSLPPPGAPLGAPWPFPTPNALDSWLKIGQDGKVTVFTGATESGQGRTTSFAQIVAEELDVSVAAVRFVMGDTAVSPEQGDGGGSRGIRFQVKPLQYAAAEARNALLKLAAARFGVPTAQLTTSDGVVSVIGNSSTRVTYGDLIGAQRFDLALNRTDISAGQNYVSGRTVVFASGQAKLKDPAQYKLVGQPVPRVEIPDKVSGKFSFVQNIRLPGMVHARLVLPPTPSSTLVRINGFKSGTPDGFIRTVSKGNFVAVVAEKEWQAIQAMQMLDVVWSTPQPTLPTSGSLFAALRAAPTVTADDTTWRAPSIPGQITNPNRGNVSTALAGAAKVVKADYHFPLQQHGSIGPACSVAHVSGGQAVVWCPTFNPNTARRMTSEVLGVPADNVRIIFTEGSGHYGRGGAPEDTGPAAAFVSQTVGRPVRLTLMRDQEFLTDSYGLPYSFQFAGGVDGQGNVVAWDMKSWTWAVDPRLEGPTLTTLLAGPVPTGAFRSNPGHSLGGGDMSAYEFPNSALRNYNVAPSLRVGSHQLRSPKRIQLNFATESFMDELAAAAGADPIAFRIRQLEATKKLAAGSAPTLDPMHYNRTIASLEMLKQAAAWETRPSPTAAARKGSRVLSGRGCATMGNYCNAFGAVAAEVEVDMKTGKVRVTKLTSVVDPGLTINPRGARTTIAQAEIFALSRTLREEVKFDTRNVMSRDWVTYPILRFADVPDQKTVIINRPEYPAGGIGEGPEILVPAAVGNAIFDATGIRMRRVPFTPERVRAALKAASS